ncbi:hypothetical protein WME98_37660 [Sorangium sp. So ce296]|uniref:hypothetical protein n=1 Tax=Sorangium sp. So ce296 TaxID=3133296 RepID=UPI003F62430E
MLNDKFETIKTSLASRVHPRRWQVIHVFAHDRAATEAKFEPRIVACEYAEFMRLQTEQLSYFCQARRSIAEDVCMAVAEFDVVMSSRQMPRDVAAALTTAWLGQFDEETVFLTNGDVSGSKARGKYLDQLNRSLFFTDREAGVLAVSPARCGIFWSAENS